VIYHNLDARQAVAQPGYRTLRLPLTVSLTLLRR
jgi:hypothetical protein